MLAMPHACMILTKETLLCLYLSECAVMLPVFPVLGFSCMNAASLKTASNSSCGRPVQLATMRQRPQARSIHWYEGDQGLPFAGPLSMTCSAFFFLFLSGFAGWKQWNVTLITIMVQMEVLAPIPL